MNAAYKAGFENGQLCRKYSNQHATEPTEAEWTEAYLDPIDRDGLGDRDDGQARRKFVEGCRAGWAHGSGSVKV